MSAMLAPAYAAAVRDVTAPPVPPPADPTLAILRRYIAFLEEGHDPDDLWDMRRAAGIRPGDVEGPVEV